MEGVATLEMGGSVTTTDIGKATSKAQVNSVFPLDVIYVTEEVYWSSSPATPH